MKRSHLLVVSLFLAIAAVAWGQSAQAGVARAIINTKNTSYGTILVDGSGRTVYLSVADAPGKSKCTGGCAAIWPPVKTSSTPKAQGHAQAALLGTIKLKGGAKQATYKGHPLYYFASDSKRKPIGGEGQAGFYVVSPSGAKITALTKTTTSTSTSGYRY